MGIFYLNLFFVYVTDMADDTNINEAEDTDPQAFAEGSDIEDFEPKINEDVEEDAEDFVNLGGFLKLRQDKALLSWEQLNHSLEVKFGVSRTLTLKPTDDDVNLVLDWLAFNGTHFLNTSCIIGLKS